MSKNSLEDTFLKNLPSAAALSLPSTNYLPSAPAQKGCPIFPLRQKLNFKSHCVEKGYNRVSKIDSSPNLGRSHFRTMKVTNAVDEV